MLEEQLDRGRPHELEGELQRALQVVLECPHRARVLLAPCGERRLGEEPLRLLREQKQSEGMGTTGNECEGSGKGAIRSVPSSDSPA